jgi:hypothetical protein
VVSTFDSSPEQTVAETVPEHRYALMEACGALKALQVAYRAAIEAALPGDVSLCGDQFVGPAAPDAGDWDGYPQTDNGGLDIQACVDEVDLNALVDRYEVVTLEEIGRDVLQSAAANPASAASQALRRLGVKPLARCQIDGRGQAVAVYYLRNVQQALAARPGRGARRDLAS